MDIQQMTAEQKIQAIKNVVDNFDNSLTFERVVINGRLCTFINANDYLYLKTQINSYVATNEDKNESAEQPRQKDNINNGYYL